MRVLAFAVADCAFVNNIKSVADLFRLRPPKEKKHLEFHWHSSKLDTPIFREPVYTVNGRETSPTKGLTYATHRRNTNRLGEHTGFDLAFNGYSMRRGAGNAIESKSPKRFSSHGRTLTQYRSRNGSSAAAGHEPQRCSHLSSIYQRERRMRHAKRLPGPPISAGDYQRIQHYGLPSRPPGAHGVDRR
jgi:hypothetical protein